MAYTKTLSLTWPAGSSGRSYIEGYEAPPAFSVNNRTVVAKRTRSGVSQPKWAQIIANGGNATTPLTAEWESWDYSRDDCVLRYKSTVYPNWTYIRECRGDLPLIGLWSAAQRTMSTSTSEVWNQAAVRYNRKVRELYRSMQGLVSMGELRETLQMLKRPALGIRKLGDEWISFLRKRHKTPGSFKRAVRNSPKYLADAWLEKSFGWVPLWQDAQDAVKAYKDITRSITKPDVRTISAGARKWYDKTSDLTGINRVGGTKIVQFGPTYRCVVSFAYDEIIVRFRGKVKLSNETNQWNSDVFSTFGLNVSEFIPTAWELLPWSFLFDYFTNIGDCLDSMTTFAGDVVFTNQSLITLAAHRGEWVVDTGLSRPGGAGNWRFASQEGKGRVHLNMNRRQVSRSAGVGFPFPRVQWNIDLSDGQLSNIAALLGSALGLHPQRRPFRAYRLPGM